MSNAENPAADPILGTAVEDAVAVVVDREEEADRESVRSALELVAADGTVSRAGIDSALGEAAQYVATPENRLELTGDALESARALAAPAAELGVVQSRLDGFEARYRDIEADVDDLRARLDALVERGTRPDDVYDVARSLRALKWDARDAHGDAEELRADLESFETWASDPDARFDELDDDVDHIGRLLDGLAAAVDDLESGATADELDPAVVWADATLQHRVAGLLVDDLRAELSDLRAWPAGETTGDERDGSARASASEERIDNLRERDERLGERLASLARPAWRERFGDRIEAVDADIESFDPPVPWGAVQETLAEHRSALDGVGAGGDG